MTHIGVSIQLEVISLIVTIPLSCLYSTATILLIYGISLWNLESTDINQFYVTWRKLVRKILGVPY